MDITLFERINRTKLNQVLECDNIPFQLRFDSTMKNTLYKTLNMYKKKINKNDLIPTKYTQNHKYGRYNTSYGLQTFQKDVRKFISGEFYDDIDISNCHPVILNKLLKDNNAKIGSTECVKSDGRSLLTDYVENRDEYLLKNKMTKIEIIKLINNQDCKLDFFQPIHRQIYKELLPVLIKDNKLLFNRIKTERKKAKKDYNHEGAFLATYLQNIENNILMVMYGYLNEKHYTIGSLMFDGLMVEKTNDLCRVEEEFPFIKQLIKEKTGFDIDLVVKSMKTDWTPNKIEKVIMERDTPVYSNKFDIEAFNNLSNVKEPNEEGVLEINIEKLNEFLKYTNLFICLFEEPHCYGWRDNMLKNYNIRSAAQIADRTGPIGLNLWKNSNAKQQYEKMVFIVDEEHFELKNNVYNRYIRPPMKALPEDTNIYDKCPLFFDFIKRIISNNDELIFEYLLNYIAKMFQKGMTKQLLVLMGLMGTGKGTFCELLTEIVGNNYSQTMNDIHQMSSSFNSLSQTSIITIVEEVVNDAGDFHRINSKLKSLITESKILIEKKGIDQFMDYSNNNIIINTNGENPVHITNDNRRTLIITVNPLEKNNRQMFVNLRNEFNENVEYIRQFFYDYKFNDDLNSIRPTTTSEIQVRNLNKTSCEMFVEEALYLSGNRTNNCRKSTFVFDTYKLYCKENNYKATSHKYFRREMEKNTGHLFYVNKLGKFVQGFYENNGNNTDDGDDKIEFLTDTDNDNDSDSDIDC